MALSLDSQWISLTSIVFVHQAQMTLSFMSDLLSKKEKGDRAQMIELRPPFVVIRVTVYLENTASLQTSVQ
jgi:hypothetical protein